MEISEITKFLLSSWIFLIKLYDSQRNFSTKIHLARLEQCGYKSQRAFFNIPFFSQICRIPQNLLQYICIYIFFKFTFSKAYNTKEDNYCHRNLHIASSLANHYIILTLLKQPNIIKPIKSNNIYLWIKLGIKTHKPRLINQV